MTEFTWLAPAWLGLLLLLPGVLWLAARFEAKAQARRRLWGRFETRRADLGASGASGASGAPVPRGSRRRLVLRALAWMLLTAALARPAWSPVEVAPEEPGQGTVFLVDVSRSMLAADQEPNRLAAVKQALRRLVPDLRGDEAALVAFAGNAVLRSPLTRDRAFLLQAVDGLDPANVTQGGFDFAKALIQVNRVFSPRLRKGALWIFTDGGEPSPEDAGLAYEQLNLLKDRGWRIYVWGLGGDEPAPVPDRPAVTALNRPFLEVIAGSTPPGSLFTGDPRDFALTYREHWAPSNLMGRGERLYTEGAWALALAGALLVLFLEFERRIAARFLLGLLVALTAASCQAPSRLNRASASASQAPSAAGITVSTLESQEYEALRRDADRAPDPAQRARRLFLWAQAVWLREPQDLDLAFQLLDRARELTDPASELGPSAAGQEADRAFRALVERHWNLAAAARTQRDTEAQRIAEARVPADPRTQVLDLNAWVQDRAEIAQRLEDLDRQEELIRQRRAALGYDQTGRADW